MIRGSILLYGAIAALICGSVIAAPTVSNTAPPKGAVPMNGDFSVTGVDGPKWTAYYGVAGRPWYTVTGSGPSPLHCNPATFGGDPAPNVKKNCYIVGMTRGVNACAADFGNCAHPGAGTVIYGVFGRTARLNVTGSGSLRCEPAKFQGDPAPNVAKNCFFFPALAPVASQAKPTLKPSLAAPSNQQIVVEQQKAPVPIVMPLGLTDAQKAEYSRWTDAKREEFLRGYQPLTTDAQRAEYIRSRLTPTTTTTAAPIRTTTTATTMARTTSSTIATATLVGNLAGIKGGYLNSKPDNSVNKYVTIKNGVARLQNPYYKSSTRINQVSIAYVFNTADGKTKQVNFPYPILNEADYFYHDGKITDAAAITAAEVAKRNLDWIRLFQ